jgi:predicted O-methyltransferase YrrM
MPCAEYELCFTARGVLSAKNDQRKAMNAVLHSSGAGPQKNSNARPVSDFRNTWLSRSGRPVTLRRIYAGAIRRFLRVTFPFWERLGIHAVPVHFYHPIPDTRTLTNDVWTRQYPLTGIDINLPGQLDLLATFEKCFRAEYEQFPHGPTSSGFYLNNTTFQAVDAEILYCIIRHFKPRRICEVGSGFSTRLMTSATLANEAEGGERCQITAIEPNPPPDLNNLPNVRLLQMPVEKLPLEQFDELGSNDILFIDSSHCIRTGGDVIREYLDILPRLRPGVIVHCHDIFLPGEYPRKFVTGECEFWTEQYLFHAFLLFNSSFRVVWSGHYLHLNHSKLLNNAFSSYVKCATPPSSFWIRRVG